MSQKQRSARVGTLNAPPEPFVFFRRSFPSANTVLVRGDRPVLVDSGFGGDVAETERLLREARIAPESVTLIANSHYHCDHAGGNGAFQARYGTSVAAHRWEADLVNRRDPEACGARWLAQPIEPYRVVRRLSDGDLIDAGGVLLEVYETPGHTLGHLSFYEPERRVLLCGDALHADDVAWVSPFREGVGAIQRAMESVERLRELKVEWACSGHGPAIRDFRGAAEAALARYAVWLEDPRRPAWHACKRIFAYALMLEDGMDRERIRAYLSAAPWFADHARYVFGLEPEEFVEPLLAEMIRSGAAGWSGGTLRPSAPYSPPPPGWPEGPSKPSDWPTDQLAP
ncbi:Metallo-beta-lactamase superfamily [Rubrobacter radiotolerans]|uniref:Metallo-beta-lactamase superfamily n=1 Tax=Rubrobacter radiotolerans TaxID=42256 RepID=A0A023X3C2_RUBRA|nr:MBL fold metallo-hydrolase [Rubrobacter radiotolerans]AHY46544.1 Metallo-beta-lactamase superfamily [Rubrobacter radiotolerans]SMC04846.1 Glyoxylase, beta-lactamase superfamily II [Rubrobacter radiotolerans DSM 5868]